MLSENFVIPRLLSWHSIHIYLNQYQSYIRNSVTIPCDSLRMLISHLRKNLFMHRIISLNVRCLYLIFANISLQIAASLFSYAFIVSAVHGSDDDASRTRKLLYFRAEADTGRNLTNIRCRRPRASMGCNVSPRSIKRDGPHPMHPDSIERILSIIAIVVVRRTRRSSRIPGDVLLDERTCFGVNSHG